MFVFLDLLVCLNCWENTCNKFKLKICSPPGNLSHNERIYRLNASRVCVHLLHQEIKEKRKTENAVMWQKKANDFEPKVFDPTLTGHQTKMYMQKKVYGGKRKEGTEPPESSNPLEKGNNKILAN